jgi:hypothetical protein
VPHYDLIAQRFAVTVLERLASGIAKWIEAGKQREEST